MLPDFKPFYRATTVQADWHKVGTESLKISPHTSQKSILEKDVTAIP
jgi:hypothetical protein